MAQIYVGAGLRYANGIQTPHPENCEADLQSTRPSSYCLSFESVAARETKPSRNKEGVNEMLLTFLQCSGISEADS